MSLPLPLLLLLLLLLRSPYQSLGHFAARCAPTRGSCKPLSSWVSHLQPSSSLSLHRPCSASSTAKATELLVTAAGGRFSADIDAATTIVVTGLASARNAMNATDGHNSRYTLALRQKVDSSRSGCVYSPCEAPTITYNAPHLHVCTGARS